jgi:hypothetical protein
VCVNGAYVCDVCFVCVCSVFVCVCSGDVCVWCVVCLCVVCEYVCGIIGVCA